MLPGVHGVSAWSQLGRQSRKKCIPNTRKAMAEFVLPRYKLHPRLTWLAQVLVAESLSAFRWTVSRRYSSVEITSSLASPASESSGKVATSSIFMASETTNRTGETGLKPRCWTLRMLWYLQQASHTTLCGESSPFTTQLRLRDSL